ncbi:MAG: hypothetical protein ACEPOV_00280 [Hyphomicrobiales bacterium]
MTRLFVVVFLLLTSIKLLTSCSSSAEIYTYEFQVQEERARRKSIRKEIKDGRREARRKEKEAKEDWKAYCKKLDEHYAAQSEETRKRMKASYKRAKKLNKPRRTHPKGSFWDRLWGRSKDTYYPKKHKRIKDEWGKPIYN